MSEYTESEVKSLAGIFAWEKIITSLLLAIVGGGFLFYQNTIVALSEYSIEKRYSDSVMQDLSETLQTLNNTMNGIVTMQALQEQTIQANVRSIKEINIKIDK